jgi:hypothetical protein
MPRYTRYTWISRLENAINPYKFVKAGQLRRVPNSYNDAIRYLLDLWFDDSDGAPGRDLGGAPGAESTAGNSALASGDVEMSMDSTNERSENVDKSDPLMDLALHLNLLSPATPPLSEEDRHDLALLDKLTQTHTRLQQVLALETEIVATEKWNFDAVTQLLDLAKRISRIPFASRSEIFDLEPTAAEPESSALPGLASKGKGRLKEEVPKKKSVYHMIPDDARKGWAGSSGEIFLLPLPNFNS